MINYQLHIVSDLWKLAFQTSVCSLIFVTTQLNRVHELTSLITLPYSLGSNTLTNTIKFNCTVAETDTCLKKMLVAKVVALKLGPAPFSSKERVRSEGLLDWDKLLLSPTEFLPGGKRLLFLHIRTHCSYY